MGLSQNNSPGVAIIGCGLIGRKRAAALNGARLVACSDLDKSRAQSLASSSGSSVRVIHDWRDVLSLSGVDIVVVSTTNEHLADITLGAVRAGKHVIVEKPAARNSRELAPLIEAARENGVRVRVGFNHRYHPALMKAAELCRDGKLGDLMFVRGRYGHGGRVGYNLEWRADPVRSGGGELVDQGVHLIDLARTFLGDFVHVEGFAHTYFWDMPVDDNAFMLLRTRDQQTAFLHVSCTEWKNMFSFEIYGAHGKLQIDGLGGSYGVERLTHYSMREEMGPPDTTSWEYPRGDESWSLEFAEFLDDIRLEREPAAGLEDARAALDVVQAIYEQSK
jgi:predicted dehydrogenase